MLITTAGTSFAGVWYLDNYGWWYQNDDGSYPAGTWQLIDGYWYYFDNYGYMKTGWLLDNGYWYYLLDSGAMVTGWLLDNGCWYYLTDYGFMVTGWQYAGNDWYYFNDAGVMAEGWQYINGSWYYFDETTGVMVTGTRTINGTVYYFYPTGQWIEEGYSGNGGNSGSSDNVSGNIYWGCSIQDVKNINGLPESQGYSSETKDNWLAYYTDELGPDMIAFYYFQDEGLYQVLYTTWDTRTTVYDYDQAVTELTKLY